VMGGEILDQNFARTRPLIVRQATLAYVRLVNPSSVGSTEVLALHAVDSDGAELDSGVQFSASRVGTSTVFLAPVTLVPDGDHLASGATIGHVLNDAPTAPLRLLPGGVCMLRAEQANATLAENEGMVPLKMAIAFVDPTGSPVAEQYTVVEGQNHNYAEKTYLKVSIINPHKSADPPKDAAPCAFLRELPMDGTGQSSQWLAQSPRLVFTGQHVGVDANPYDNNVSNGGDSLEDGFPVGLSHGVSTARPSPESDTTFFLRAVARRRDTPVTDFGALIYATACPSVVLIDDSNALESVTGQPTPTYLDMWVDQDDYFPMSSPPGRHPGRHGSSKVSIDWIEKEALDVLSAPTGSEPDAFSSVLRLYTNGYDPSSPNAGAWTGYVPHNWPYLPEQTDPILNHAVRVNHFQQGLRWGLGRERYKTLEGLSQNASPVDGLIFQLGLDRLELFQMMISHEARHSLQHAISMDVWQTNDVDRDGFVQSLTANGVTLTDGERLLDQSSVLSPRGGANPEFDPHGDDPATVCSDAQSSRAAVERDAYLHQRSSTNLQFLLAGAGQPTQVQLGPSERRVVSLPILQKPAPAGLAQLQYYFDGNVLFVSVQAGGCLVDDGVWSPASSALTWATVPRDANNNPITDATGVPLPSQFWVGVTAPSSAGQNCTIRITPYVPTDATGTPLVPVVSQTLSVVVAQ